MRKVEFNVPSEVMVEFAEELVNRNLNNSIIGSNEDGEVIIEVEYDKNESGDVDALEDLLDDLIEESEDENED
ncbi:MAG: hypothetical protein HY841_13850 [Bacteroidetes bacterium]|nr:hypothetical protein [Bacteroidota bacterium]